MFNQTTLMEPNYEELREDGKTDGGRIHRRLDRHSPTNTGWPRWPSIRPKKVAASFTHFDPRAGANRYQTDLRGRARGSLRPAKRKSVSGLCISPAPRNSKLLDQIATDPGLTQFDLAIDFRLVLLPDQAPSSMRCAGCTASLATSAWRSSPSRRSCAFLMFPHRQ